MENSSKGDFISNLLNSTKPNVSQTPRIEELDSSENVFPNSHQTAEEPSLLELMMQAQATAKKEKDKLIQTQTKIELKSFGGGFKKGFLSSTPKSNPKTATKVFEPKSKSSSSTAIIPTISRSTSSTSSAPTEFVEEVQRAMKEDKNPLVNQLEKGEWVTPSLLEAFQANPVISRGLTSPKCQQALSLMRSDPKEAQRRFAGDAEVDLFMREFGQMMSVHFTQMGESQGSQQRKSGLGDREEGEGGGSKLIEEVRGEKKKGGKGIEEIGILHSEAIRRDRERRETEERREREERDREENERENEKRRQREREEEERARSVLSDPELRALLMDPQMQKILQECSDPRLYRQYMSDPATRAKIEKMMRAGLVGREG